MASKLHFGSSKFSFIQLLQTSKFKWCWQHKEHFAKLGNHRVNYFNECVRTAVNYQYWWYCCTNTSVLLELWKHFDLCVCLRIKMSMMTIPSPELLFSQYCSQFCFVHYENYALNTKNICESIHTFSTLHWISKPDWASESIYRISTCI